VSGRIAKLSADFNSTVKKGEVIAKIDPQLFAAAVEREKANYVAAKAGVIRAEAQQRDADLAQKRAKSLNDQGLASAAELQTADTNLAVAIAQTEVAKATLQQQSAALNQAQVNLSYTDIHSPIDGIVISRSVDVGQTVAASLQAPVLFTIAEDLRKMQVHTSVAEGDVGRLQPGMESWFTVDAFPGQRFRGKISQIRNAAQTVQNVVTYDVVVSASNPDDVLKPGMTATVRIITEKRQNVLRIPDQALRYTPGGVAGTSGGNGGDGNSMRPVGDGSDSGSNAAVWVLRNGHPVRVPVTIGLDDDANAEIVSGDLHPGDKVIVSEQANAGSGGRQSSSSTPRLRF
jgi:HlyD family secretion protein